MLGILVTIKRLTEIETTLVGCCLSLAELKLLALNNGEEKLKVLGRVKNGYSKSRGPVFDWNFDDCRCNNDFLFFRSPKSKRGRFVPANYLFWDSLRSLRWKR